METLLQMRGITKAFGGVTVLDDVDIDVRPGEVHAVMGENGAGKSTLMKILTGVYPKDGGTIELSGRAVEIDSRTQAAKLGIGMIYQELSLIPTLTVEQNVMLSEEATKAGVLSIRAMHKRVSELIRDYGFRLSADALVETLSIAQRQTVEILKTLSRECSLIIMDEPTASLSNRESQTLFEIIKTLKEQGIGILYISHRLDEVFELADRLTVLHDGTRVATVERDIVAPADIVKMMLGKELKGDRSSRLLRPASSPVVLEVEHLSRKGLFEDVCFQAHRGEILGIGGLVGSGRTEVLRCIFGIDIPDSGEIKFDGRRLTGSTRRRILQGFGMIPEDRRGQGLVPLLSVERNVAVSNYDSASRVGIVDLAREKRLGTEAVTRLDIRPARPNRIVSNLSGGNAQKVVLGKWLLRDLKVLLVDEPTSGIDVGAKEEIYTRLRELADQGVTIIMVSSDLAELLRVSDRILVFHRGRVHWEYSEGRVFEESILLAASGLAPEEGRPAR